MIKTLKRYLFLGEKWKLETMSITRYSCWDIFVTKTYTRKGDIKIVKKCYKADSIKAMEKWHQLRELQNDKKRAMLPPLLAMESSFVFLNNSNN